MTTKLKIAECPPVESEIVMSLTPCAAGNMGAVDVLANGEPILCLTPAADRTVKVRDVSGPSAAAVRVEFWSRNDR